METTPSLPNKKRKSHNFRDARTRLIDRFNSAKFYMPPSGKITEIFTSLREDYKLTIAEWEYLRGYLDALRENLYHTRLYFAYVIEGRILEFKDMSQDQINKITSNPNCHHYWIDLKGNKTTNIFF